MASQLPCNGFPIDASLGVEKEKLICSICLNLSRDVSSYEHYKIASTTTHIILVTSSSSKLNCKAGQLFYCVNYHSSLFPSFSYW
jgi:hypothetical protein